MGWFVGGGFPMVFIVVFGGIALAGAARFALFPASGRLPAVAAYAAAVVFAALSGVCVDLATTLRSVGALDDVDPEQRARIVMVGAAESLAPAILGFAIVGVVCLIAAIGLRRMPAP
ncbi:MAG: hypothetical protein ABMB14_01295 [Myxococcota bacterium]